MDYEKYKEGDGSYKSPKNGKIYKTKKAFIAHWHNPGTGGWKNVNSSFNYECQYCQTKKTAANIKKHEDSCYLNTANIRLCQVCEKPIKNYKGSKGTCSHACANILFRSGENNGMYKGTHYTQICFTNHKKECIICGEFRIVAVHHMNEDHGDNRPENLVPLCPTHHTYMHSKYKDMILPQVEKYLKEFNGHGH